MVVFNFIFDMIMAVICYINTVLIVRYDYIASMKFFVFNIIIDVKYF